MRPGRARLIVRWNDREHAATVHPDGHVSLDAASDDYEVRRVSASEYRVRLHGRTRRLWTAEAGPDRWVFLDGRAFRLEVTRAESPRQRRQPPREGLSAPMPATVVAIRVEPGVVVAIGDTLVVLEAMKMELLVRASRAGTVTAVHCTPGDLVQPGVSLIELTQS